MVGLPWSQQPLKHPERYSGTWRIKGLVLPEPVAREFFCANRFEPSPDGRLIVRRRVEYPLRRKRERNWRKIMRGDTRAPGTMVWLPPGNVVARAATLVEGGHLECWQWATDYVDRGTKPIPPTSAWLTDVTVEELESTAGTPGEVVETLDFQGYNGVANPVPEAWLARAVLKYPNLCPLGGPYYVDWLDGETLEDVLQLASEVSEALDKRSRRRRSTA
jgi:hypothetical protein